MRKFTLFMLILSVSVFFQTTSACEDFDALTPGGYVAGQLGGYWTTWGGNPGGADDAFVTDANSHSPSNSFAIDDAGIDLVFQFGDAAITTGQWMYSHYMYVPSGVTGYFNVQTDPTPGVDWNLEIFFQDGGTGYFAGQSTETFVYTQDTWFMVEIMYDLDAGMGYMYIDGTLILEFANTLSIGGIDYWGWADEGDPGALYDDVCFDEYSVSAGFCDFFDDYTAGDFLCTQSMYWTTWDDNPGGAYDAMVSDAMAQTPANSVDIDAAVMESDIVTDLGQTTSGVWSIAMEVYIPAGATNGGYWNIMQDMELFGAANEWGFQIYYKSDGTGYFYDANFNQFDFTYMLGEWTYTEVVIDLDNAMAKCYVDGTMFGEWQWDVAGPNMLGAVDIYAAADGNDDPKMYVDNFCFQEAAPASPCDDFDDLVAGDFLCTQSDNWTTWDDNPGGDYDAYVTDAMANSAPNSIDIDAAVLESDIVTDLGQATEGTWSISLDIYVPDGGTYGGYFNVMQDMELFGAANEWGFQIYFKSDGTGYFYDANFNQTDFDYPIATWLTVTLVVNLDMAMADLWFDGVLVGEPWQWDIAGPNMLGAVDIYAAADGNDDPKMYVDNYCFEELEPSTNCDNFDDLMAGDFLCTQSDNWTTWDDNPGGAYDAYITDEMSKSEPNSIDIDAAVLESDIVYDLGQKVAGAWAIELDIYVPDGGYGGYYNVMQDMELFGAANEWGFQVYFKSDGTGYMYDAIFNQFDFEYVVGDWNHSAVYVDLDADLAQYEINGQLIATWQWSVAGPLMLGAVDIYAAADGNDDPKFYIDNFCYDMTSIGVGIEDPIAEASVTAHIYPNPARDQITIESESIIDEVRIYNNMGQLVYSGEFNNDQIMVNTSNFNTGMYIVQVRSGEAIEVRKLIIE